MTISRTFHGSYILKNQATQAIYRPHAKVTSTKQHRSYQFFSHYHPFVSQLLKKLTKHSVEGLQSLDTKLKENTTISDDGIQPDDYDLYKKLYDHAVGFSEEQPYWPTEIVTSPDSIDNKEPEFPVEKLDFTYSGAYSNYNWELFFHIPITVAIHLSKNQRFQEAQQWFHFIFDPTDNSDGPTPERFWKVKPFQTTDVKNIHKILTNLSSNEDSQLLEETTKSIEAWKDNPFQPHTVARHRQTAYMLKTVMAYLDNLIDWGDSLFQQDSIESINEATQVYVMAANILGQRPKAIPKKGTVKKQTYAQMRKGIDAMGNALRQIEANVVFDLMPFPMEATNNPQQKSLNSIGKILYFAIPQNEKLLGYWDTVADRFYKIHNSLNLQGTFRQLPLFQPPIDPALLASAKANGIEIGAVISGLNQPLPLVRFQLLVQKATEICQEVKSLGGNLLSAIEKEDNEALALLRSQHEQSILVLTEGLKYAQWQEAIQSRLALVESLKNVARRYSHYQQLLGIKKTDLESLTEINDLNIHSLEELNFDSSNKSNRQPYFEKIPYGNAESAQGGLGGVTSGLLGVDGITGALPMSASEAEELSLLESAQFLQDIASIADLSASGLSLVPQFNAKGQPLGVGVSTGFGGVQLSKMTALAASASRGVAGRISYEASRAAKLGSYARRSQDWMFQSNLALGEIKPILKQLRAAQIREFIAQKDYKNHQKQIQNAKEIEHFLKGDSTSVNGKNHKKVSTQSLYAWMKREVRSLHSQCFQFAFDVAKKAERALQHELGDPSLNYIKFNYQAGKEGLLAGEKLHLDIKRMEMAYHDQNQREYELTKHISLLQLDPLQLLDLKYKGSCTVKIPEEAFDIDCPGHYFRRIKNVAVTIPCVTGPYTSINCTLTLTKSTIRKSALVGSDGYDRAGTEDPRFDTYYGSSQSIVTSTGQSDSGLFETNLRDERYLPFENAGVDSTWQLSLPGNPQNEEPIQFDYNTISDVILHFRYTAREGGSQLKKAAITSLKNKLDEANSKASTRLFSIRHEFPAEWAKFKNSKSSEPLLTIALRKEHYPFWMQNHLDQPVYDVQLSEVRDKQLNELGTPDSIPKKLVEDTYTLTLSDRDMEELWLAIRWNKSE